MDHNLFPPETVTLEGIASLNRVISLEAGGLSQTFSAATGKFSHLLGDAKRFIDAILNPYGASARMVDSRKVEKGFHDVNYALAQPLGVVVPAGFRTTWLDYINMLSKSQGALDNLQPGLLKPFELYLGTLLNTPDLLKALSAPSSLTRYKAPDIDAIKGEFAKAFDKGGKTTSTYGAVIKRHSDLPIVTRDLNEVNTRFATIDRKALAKQVGDISILLQTLMDNIKSDPETYVVSGATLKTLSEMTYLMAREVEYYSVHGYFLEAFTTSVKDSYDKLEKVLSA